MISSIGNVKIIHHTSLPWISRASPQCSSASKPHPAQPPLPWAFLCFFIPKNSQKRVWAENCHIFCSFQALQERGKTALFKPLMKCHLQLLSYAGGGLWVLSFWHLALIHPISEVAWFKMQQPLSWAADFVIFQSRFLWNTFYEHLSQIRQLPLCTCVSVFGNRLPLSVDNNFNAHTCAVQSTSLSSFPLCPL